MHQLTSNVIPRKKNQTQIAQTKEKIIEIENKEETRRSWKTHFNGGATVPDPINVLAKLDWLYLSRQI